MHSQQPSKVVEIKEVASFFKDGMTLMCGGFGGVGAPPALVNLILNLGVKDIKLISNDVGFPWIGPGKLVSDKRVRKLIASHIGSNPEAGKQMHTGELDVVFYPQGTLAEKIRAGGMGLGGILVDVGFGTLVEKGKQIVDVRGQSYMIEPALTADVSIVYAKQADSYGNLTFDKSARNTNPHIATAGDITIVEAEQILKAGELNPECVVTPGAFVDYVVQSKGVDWKWVWELKQEDASQNGLQKK